MLSFKNKKIKGIRFRNNKISKMYFKDKLIYKSGNDIPYDKILGYWNIKQQGLTNTSEDKTIKDLSKNGNDLLPKQIDWTLNSGISSDGTSLIFNGWGYLITDINKPIVIDKDYTIIMDYTSNVSSIDGGYMVYKSPGSLFIIRTRDRHVWKNFSDTQFIIWDLHFAFTNNISYSVNGGSYTNDSQQTLTDSPSQLVIGARIVNNNPNNPSNYINMSLRSLVIFNNVNLTKDQIFEVFDEMKNNTLLT